MAGRLQPRPLARSEIHSDHLAQLREYLRWAYGPTVRVDCSGAPNSIGRCDHVRLRAGLFALDQIRVTGESSLWCDGLVDPIVIWVQGGSVEYRLGTKSLRMTRGELAMTGAADEPVDLRVTDARLTVVTLSRSLLVEFGSVHRRPRDADAADALKRTISYVADTLHSGAEIATAPVCEALAALLATSAESSFAQFDPDEHDANGRYPAALQLAMRYIDDNAALRVTIADIAAEIFVTPRTVQHLFRRYLDMTPTAYLREVRLKRVRIELLNGDANNTTVTASATRWGFRHTGRFAVLYREKYGESPHQTLRRP